MQANLHGLVQPEDLTSHINDAVYTAGANRIGHGVDMAYESKRVAALHGKNKVAIEINLVSNEFILKVKENRHPISLYRAFEFHCDQYRRRRDTKNEHDRAVCFIG
jgi:adenosine deaminase/adenosine deaminase CECR1